MSVEKENVLDREIQKCSLIYMCRSITHLIEEHGPDVLSVEEVEERHPGHHLLPHPVTELLELVQSPVMHPVPGVGP